MRDMATEDMATEDMATEDMAREDTATEVELVPAAEEARLPDTASDWDDWGGPAVSGTDVLGRMLVLADGAVVGDVSWHEEWYGPTAGSCSLNLGIALIADARGRGIGSRAQRLLAEHLFSTTEVARVEATTDVANLAEQRALEKAGFTREGVLRSAQARGDGLHDLVVYSILRGEVVTDPA
jgi:RimJ/RimL family protein N-acetyltransferase